MNVSDLAPAATPSSEDALQSMQRSAKLSVPVAHVRHKHGRQASVASCCPSSASIVTERVTPRATVCCRVPASVLVVAVAIFVVLLSTAVCFAVILHPLQQNLDGYVESFADEYVAKVSASLSRHYRVRYTVLSWLGDLCNQIDLLPNVSDASTLVKWVGQVVETLDIRVVYILSDGAGFSITSFSAIDTVRFPAVAGRVVADRFNASETVATAQYYTTSGILFGAVVDYPNVTYNVSNQPGGVFYGVKRPYWTKPYVSFQTRTSAIVAGRNFSVWSAARSTTATGLITVVDLTQQVISYLRSLKVAKTGLVILVDTFSGAFVGGNFVEDSTVTEPGLGPAARRTRLATLSDLKHPVASRLARASAAAGDAITHCRPPCHLYLTESGELQTSSVLSNRHLSIFEDFTIVRVASIVDDHGIDMRLVIVLPTGDFASGVRRGALTGITVSVVVLFVVLCGVTVFVHRTLKPLEVACEQMRRLADRQRSGGLSVGSSEADLGDGGICCDALLFREMDTLKRALDRLMCELRVFSSFLPTSAQLLRSVLSPHGSRDEDTVECTTFDAYQVPTQNSEGAAASATHGPVVSQVFSLDLKRSVVWQRVPVTCMVVNYNGFQRLAESVPPRELLTLHTEYLSCVATAVARRGGCVAMFYGDHVLCHFNVERRLMKHAAAACTSAIEVLETLSRLGFEMPYIGVSTGECLCYTPRCTIAVLHTVGACVSQAFALCAFAKDHLGSHNAPLLPLNGTFLVSWKTAQFLSAHQELQVLHVRICLLPQDTVVKPVSTVLWRSSCSDVAASSCVWCLVLPGCTTAACTESGVVSNNLAFSLAADRRLREALKLLKASPQWSVQTNWLLKSLLSKSLAAVD